MDSFTRHFFKSHRTPGVPFVLDSNQRVWCSTVYNLLVDVDGRLQSTWNKIWQPMTPLGLMELHLKGTGSGYDGLNMSYLTPEGNISIPAVCETLKQNDASSQAFSSLHAFTWDDNHVSLLFNMLRYVFLKKFHEAGRNLDGRMGTFVDGGLSIDMDQWWPADYPESAEFAGWPNQPEVTGQGTTVECLVDAFPSENVPVVNLRSMTAEESMFVLIMLNEWKRSTRYRLDASLPILTSLVKYRGVDVTARYDAWRSRSRDQVFEPINADSAWWALRRYVCLNRLFDQFSVALYLVTALTYHYVPDVAEATPWLSIKWQASVPAFWSIRGRYSFFTAGEGAFLNQRSLDEWNHIGNRIEKINLMALTFAQAFSMGIAIRGMRRCFGLEPDDIHQTDTDFWNAETFASAAVSEFTKIKVPPSGMDGVYISCGDQLDVPDDEREVLTTTLTTTDVPDTHDYGRRRVTRKEVVPYRTPLTSLSTDHPSRDRLEARMMKLKGEADAAILKDPNSALSPDHLAALNGEVYTTRTEETIAEVFTVRVPMLPPPGFPVFLVPTEPMTYGTPYDLEGVLDHTTGDFQVNGNFLKLREAWRTFALLDSIGYDIRYEIHGATIGAKKFVKGRYSSQIWPIFYRPEASDLPVVLRSQTARADVRIRIPQFYSRFFKSHKVTYKYRVSRCCVSTGVNQDERIVSEFGGYVELVRKSKTVAFYLEENLS